MLGGSVSTKAESLTVTSKQTGLEVNADKTKYMFRLEVIMRDEVTV